MLKAAQQPLLPGSRDRHQHDKLHRSSLNKISWLLVSFACIYLSSSHAIQVQLLPPASTTAVQLQVTPTSSNTGSSNCAAHPKPAVALCMLLLGYNSTNMPRQLWLAVANRKAYAVQHGYPHYMAVQPFGSGRHPMWEKFIAIHAVMQHSCADWVWMLDSDAFIMNLQRDVLTLANNPMAVKHSEAECSSSSPDMIGAGACITKINTGSMLLRSNNWTQQFLGDTWHSQHIARPVKWGDQAGILHMLKQAGVKEHFCLVQARALNAFTDEQACNDGFGNYQAGDLVVHFPGGMKQYIASNDSKWLQMVQTRPSGAPGNAEDCTAKLDGPQDGDAHTPCKTCAGTFILGGAAVMPQPSATGHMVHVTFQSSMYGTKNGSPESFDVLIEPQSEGCDNWGWPVAQQHAPPEHSVNAGAASMPNPEPESELSGQAGPTSGDVGSHAPLDGEGDAVEGLVAEEEVSAADGEGQQSGAEGEETGGEVQEDGKGLDELMAAESEAGRAEVDGVGAPSVGQLEPELVAEGSNQDRGEEGVVGAGSASLVEQQQQQEEDQEDVHEVV